MKCRYCELEACYHITQIDSGVPQTYHVCREHSQREGIPLPPVCPQCGEQMCSGTSWKPSDKPEHRGAEWIKSFLRCPRCGLTEEV